MNKRLSVVVCAERHRFEPRSPTSTYFILLFSVTARSKLSGNERNGLSMVTWPLVVICVVTDRVTTKLLPLHSWKNECNRVSLTAGAVIYRVIGARVSRTTDRLTATIIGEGKRCVGSAAAVSAVRLYRISWLTTAPTSTCVPLPGSRRHDRSNHYRTQIEMLSFFNFTTLSKLSSCNIAANV